MSSHKRWAGGPVTVGLTSLWLVFLLRTAEVVVFGHCLVFLLLKNQLTGSHHCQAWSTRTIVSSLHRNYMGIFSNTEKTPQQIGFWTVNVMLPSLNHFHYFFLWSIWDNSTRHKKTLSCFEVQDPSVNIMNWWASMQLSLWWWRALGIGSLSSQSSWESAPNQHLLPSWAITGISVQNNHM